MENWTARKGTVTGMLTGYDHVSFDARIRSTARGWVIEARNFEGRMAEYYDELYRTEIQAANVAELKLADIVDGRRIR